MKAARIKAAIKDVAIRRCRERNFNPYQRDVCGVCRWQFEANQIAVELSKIRPILKAMREQ